MSELTFSTNAIQAMNEAGWKYYPYRNWFQRYYKDCINATEIARDLSDYMGCEVVDCDVSCREGYWYVSLSTDDECFDFAKKYKEYCNARQRISTALFGRALVLTQEQHGKVKKMAELYDKMIVGDHVLIAIPEDETTRNIVAILDALDM